MLLKRRKKTKRSILQDNGHEVTFTSGHGRRKRVYTLDVPTAGMLLAKDLPERRYLLEPWLREQESALLYSATGVGKSLLALSVAVSVAGGGRFLGWKPMECPRATGWRVLYVDGEMHLGDIQDRLRRFLAGGGPSMNKEKIMRNVRFLSRQGQDTEPWFPEITDPVGVNFYIDLIRDWEADLVVFDNFSTLAEVKDENDASALNAVTKTLLALKQLGVATILVHHAGKNGDYRGSSKIAATFEVILKLTATDPGSEGGGVGRQAAFIAEFTKMRGGYWPEDVCASLVSEQLLDGEYKWKWDSELINGSRVHDIKQLLEEEKVISQKEIAAKLDTSEPTISRAMKMAKQRGIVTQRWINRQFRAAADHRVAEASVSEVPDF